jgi:hypothetical protein
MTPVAQEAMPPLTDPGNILLARVPCNLVTGKIPVPDGELGVLTIRTPDITFTVLLTKAEVIQWADTLALLRDVLSGSGLVIPVRGQAMQIADAARAADGGRRS